MLFLLKNKTLQLNNFKTRTAMNAKISVSLHFVRGICAVGITLHHGTTKYNPANWQMLKTECYSHTNNLLLNIAHSTMLKFSICPHLANFCIGLPFPSNTLLFVINIRKWITFLRNFFYMLLILLQALLLNVLAIFAL